jgi:hypothetical protein
VIAAGQGRAELATSLIPSRSDRIPIGGMARHPLRQHPCPRQLAQVGWPKDSWPKGPQATNVRHLTWVRPDRRGCAAENRQTDSVAGSGYWPVTR